MKITSKISGMLVGLTLLVTNVLAEAPAELQMGYMVNGKFYYNQTKPLYHQTNKCASIYGGCDKITACGLNYRYPNLIPLVRGYIRSKSGNAVKFYSIKWKKSCLVTNF